MTKRVAEKTGARTKSPKRFSGGLFFKLIISFSAVIALAVIGMGLAIIIQVGEESFAGTLVKLLTSYWLLIVVVMVLSVTLGGIMINKILKPMKPLEKAMQEVSDGDFSIRVRPDPRSATEIGELVDSFNRMVAELENNEVLKNDFISNVSHEFKTPLSSIQGYATLLADPSVSDEERIEYSQSICLAVQKLSALTGNMLKLSKLEHSSYSFEKKKFNLSEQVRMCILLSESQWSAKDLTLDINLSEITYRGDADMLAQVWQNLIDNAIKFTPTGGRIVVSLTETPQGVRFLIRDNGIGMSDKTISHIFEKFYQGDLSHSAEGNGLGLALVKRIIDAVGGSIKVESEPDKGSVFTVLLPYEQ